MVKVGVMINGDYVLMYVKDVVEYIKKKVMWLLYEFYV